MKSLVSHVVVLLLSAAILLLAQQDRCTFTGTVTDPAGASIAGVRIIITNTRTNAVFETQTNDAGQYTAPNLPTGQF